MSVTPERAAPDPAEPAVPPLPPAEEPLGPLVERAEVAVPDAGPQVHDAEPPGTPMWTDTPAWSEEPPTGPTRRGSSATRRERWQWAGVAVLALVALGIVFAAFHATKGSRVGAAGKTGSSTPTTLANGSPGGGATTTAPTTTAPPVVPTDLQPNADAAANALISSWADGDRAKALTLASPQAVSTLFSTQYQSGLAIDRGCNEEAPTVSCSFGPPGGSSPNDPLYELSVTQAPGGWYVSAVQVGG